MKIRSLALILSLLPVTVAAQQFPTVPDRSVIGRIGTGTGSGPSQEIPFSNLLHNLGLGPTTTTIGDIALWNDATGTTLKDAGGGIPSIAVVHPSSGNLAGAGCSTAHQAWWVDQNLCSTADVWQITSSDPSAAFTAIIGGTRTTGDKVTLNFTFGSGTCVAGASPACDASYTAIAGDTLQNIANGIVCAIANNPNLFTINGGTCTAGVVAPAVGQTFGGYASGSIIGYTVQITNGIAFDFNSNVALKVTSSVTGSATETVTIGNTNCGTRCSYPLDNNPAFQMARISGAAPQPGSVLNAIYSIGSGSACPTTICINYGVMANWVGNSTAGAIQSAWLLQTPNTSGSLNGGLWVGQGAYSNFGGSPFSSTALQDKGVGTLNLGTCLWFNSTPTRDATITDSLCQNSGAGQLLLVTTGTDALILSSSAGVGINTTPTGNAFVSNLGFFTGGSQTPTAGSGAALTGGATPALFTQNYGTSAYLPMIFGSLSYDFKPSNSATSGWTLSANSFAPDGDNITALGSGSNRIASVTSSIFVGGSGAASTATIESTSGAGTTDAIIGKTGSQVERFRIDTSGKFNIGPSIAPDSLLTVNANTGSTIAPPATTVAHVVGTDGVNSRVIIDTFGAIGSFGYRRADGTSASKTGLLINEGIGSFSWFGYDSSGTYSAGPQATIAVSASANWTSSDHSTFITFNTTPVGSTAVGETMRMQASGALSIGTTTDPGIGALLANTSIKSQSPTAGIGYATGAGGAVTQITSRTTGITLNNITGAITLFSAAGSATAATFTVTDSAVAATDTIHLSQKSGTNLYNLLVTAVAAGSFNVTFFTTGGTATDAPVFNFTVIKGSAS